MAGTVSEAADTALNKTLGVSTPVVGKGCDLEEQKEVQGVSLCMGRGRVAQGKVSRGQIRAEGCGEDFGFYAV